MRTLATAVVGLGRVGWQYHIPHIRQHEGFSLTAVVEPLPERAEEARTTLQVPVYPTFEDLLSNERLDLMVIASPTHYHAPQAIAAMERGIDVFCDKPIAPTLEEAQTMRAVMERTGRKFMVFQPHRLASVTLAVQQLLQSGLLGSIYMMKCTRAAYTRRNDWQSLRRYGGGMLNNYGAHFIDQLLYITRTSMAQVCCHLRTIASLGDAEDVVKALLEMESGLLIDLEINMACSLPVSSWSIYGQRGTAILDEQGQTFTVRYVPEGAFGALTLQEGLAATERRYGSGEQIPWETSEVRVHDFPEPDFYDNCYEYFALDREPLVPIAETLEVMRIIDACRKSAGWE
ncbi:MAG: Gfo/Idh/MocA family protein [Armatimonadota bacterium]